MTEEQLPAPLVPASVDLRRFPNMPLDVSRLRRSETRLRTKPEEFRAAVMLWCAAWHEVPAASLPNDDLSLADLAGYGNVVKAWRKVKAGAMRGFILCSDGRLYHEVVAFMAIGAWGSQLAGKHGAECNRIRKHNQRHKNDPTKLLRMPDFSLWITENCPEGQPYLSRWTKQRVTEDTTPMSQGQGGGVTPTDSSNRTEQRGLPLSTTVPTTTSTTSLAVDNREPDARRSTQSHGNRQWRANQATIEAEARRRGVTARVGESFESFVQRIEQTRP